MSLEINRFNKIALSALLIVNLLIAISCEDATDSNIISTAGSNFLVAAGETTLFVKDLDRGEWLPAELGLGNAPNWIIPDENRLYVISSRSNQLHVFQKLDESIELQREVDLGLEYNRNPSCGVLTNDRRLLITNFISNNLSVLNTTSFEIDTLWNTGLSPEGIAVDDNFAYVVNSNYENYSYADGSVYKYDLDSGELLDTMSVGLNSRFIEIDSEGFLHVVCVGNYDDIKGQIWVIDPSSGLDTLQILDVDGYPGRIKIDSDGVAYLASGGWFTGDGQRGLVITYDTQNLEFGPRYYPSLGVWSVAVSREDDIYIGCYDSNSIYTIKDDALIDSVQTQEPVNALAVWEIE
jgi:DNA-binding beta-propeller fold protein YncE